MASLWNQFEIVVTEFFKRGNGDSDACSKFLAGAYSVATTPISVKYSSGTIVQPVLNAVSKQDLIRKGFNEVINVGKTSESQLKPIDFLPAAIAFIKYWTPGIGVLISPLPAAPPCFAPIVAGYFLNQNEFNEVIAFNNLDITEKDLELTLKTATQGDPVVLLPSPIVLFPGNPLTLANDLHFALTQSFTPNATAKNLVIAFKKHLASIRGIYIGFKDPATPPTPIPFTIVAFNGIS